MVTIFLTPVLNRKLRPLLLQMKPGTCIVSLGFHMGDWQLDAKIATENAEGFFWNPAPTWFASTPPAGMLGLAMLFVLLTVGGWNEAAYLSSEVLAPSPTC